MSKQKGFTLIELLVVIAIIGILASIVLVSMGNARQQARDVRRQADMRQIVSAQELYYGNNEGYYTASSTPTSIGDANTTYMAVVPKDPGTGNAYGWVNNTSDNQRFCAYATMENKGTCTTTRYYTASHKGNSEACDVSSWTLNCP